MIKFSLEQKKEGGEIVLTTEGSTGEIANMIAWCMTQNIDVAAAVCGGIPTFLDAKKIDRRKFCEDTIIKGKGLRK